MYKIINKTGREVNFLNIIRKKINDDASTPGKILNKNMVRLVNIVDNNKNYSALEITDENDFNNFLRLLEINMVNTVLRDRVLSGKIEILVEDGVMQKHMPVGKDGELKVVDVPKYVSFLDKYKFDKNTCKFSVIDIIDTKELFNSLNLGQTEFENVEQIKTKIQLLEEAADKFKGADKNKILKEIKELTAKL